MSLPTPLYSIGQKVWFADCHPQNEPFDCPDCKGTKEWKVTTPAGDEFTTPCLRCSDLTHWNDKIRKMVIYVPMPRPLEIGSVTVTSYPPYMRESGPCPGDDRVQYCSGRSGSGTVASETKLYSTYEEALEASKVLAAMKNEEHSANYVKERTRNRAINSVKYSQVKEKILEDQLWESKYKMEALRETLVDAYQSSDTGEALKRFIIEYWGEDYWKENVGRL
jgi:hypothetical protein